MILHNMVNVEDGSQAIGVIAHLAGHASYHLYAVQASLKVSKLT